MAVLPITTIGDPILRQRAKPVEKVTKKTRRLIKDMLDTLYATSNGIGLAAPQVGVSERVIVIDIGEGPIVMINPRILAASGSEVDIEGCLSIPGLSGYVERASWILVEGLDERGKSLRMEAEGLLARVFQHEIDHLDGILFTDKATGLHRVEVARDGEEPAEQGEGPEEDQEGCESSREGSVERKERREKREIRRERQQDELAGEGDVPSAQSDSLGGSST